MTKNLVQNRSRFYYFFLIGFVITIGLFSRSGITPSAINPYLGDFLYAVMMFLIVGFLSPSSTTLKIALISIGICFLIELLQLSNHSLLVDIRSGKIGALILGRGFLWSDLISYFFGTFFGMTSEILIFKMIDNSSKE